MSAYTYVRPIIGSFTSVKMIEMNSLLFGLHIITYALEKNIVNSFQFKTNLLRIQAVCTLFHISAVSTLLSMIILTIYIVLYSLKISIDK